MKPFLLIAGFGYYPEAGTRDWRGCYASYEETQAKIKEEPHELRARTRSYIIDGTRYDWYEIVDLREWMNK